MRKLYAFIYIWLLTLFVELSRTEFYRFDQWNRINGRWVVLPRVKWPYFPSTFEWLTEGRKVVWENGKSPDFETYGSYVLKSREADGKTKILWANDGKQKGQFAHRGEQVKADFERQEKLKAA